MSDGAKKNWRAHVVLLGIVVLQLVGWAASHQDEEARREAYATGDTQERVWALHVLANRGEIDSEDFSVQWMRELLKEEDLLVREMAFTYDLARIRPPGVQQAYFGDHQGLDRSHFVRSYLIQQRKVGGQRVGAGLKLKRQELEWLLESMAGREVPNEYLFEYFGRRKAEMAMRKGIIDLEGNLIEPQEGSGTTPSSANGSGSGPARTGGQ